MHNPDVFGYLQFADAPKMESCRNVFWLSRFVLAQLYQAEAMDGLRCFMLGPCPSLEYALVSFNQRACMSVLLVFCRLHLCIILVQGISRNMLELLSACAGAVLDPA